MLEVELFTAEEVAIKTGRSRSTVRGLANRYGFGTKKGNLKLFTQADIDFIHNIAQTGGRPPETPEHLAKQAADRAARRSERNKAKRAEAALVRAQERAAEAAQAQAVKEAERQKKAEERKAHLRQQKAEQARRRRARQKEGTTPVREPEAS